MLISQAWAQAAGGGGGATAGIQQFLPFILIIVVFYFLLIRPQQTKAKRHKEMVKNLRRGDRVVTQGGMFATVVKAISDAELQVEIADGVRIRMLRNAVSEVLAKTAPVSGDSAKDEAKGEAANDSSGDDAPSIPAQPTAPVPQGIAGVLARLFGGK